MGQTESKPLKTLDDYLLEYSKHADIYELNYTMKKTLSEKISEALFGSIRSCLKNFSSL